jgi:hypothetical protein
VIITGSSRPTLIAALAFACLHQMEARAQEVDVNDPASVRAYREGFRAGAQKRCMFDVELRLIAEGTEFGERQRNVTEKFCTCTSEGITALVGDAQIEALKTVMTEPSLKPQRQQIVVECARSADTTSN